MQVFVYGTLTDPAQVARVVDEFSFVGDGVLEGMHRVEGEYPSLAPGGTVAGRVLETDDEAAMDAYEGVDRGLYVRVSVPVADEAQFGADVAGGQSASVRRTVEVYVGDATALDVDEPVSWPTRDGPGGASDESDRGSLEARVRAYAADCVVKPPD